MGTALAGPLQRKVLVVEDNELNRRLLEVRLEIHGYEALTTSMGAAALDIAREQQPDLILMDIQLPDIPGIEAIRRLKADEQTRDIPIIAVTALAMSYEKANILASGCDAYLGVKRAGPVKRRVRDRQVDFSPGIEHHAAGALPS